MTNDTIQPEIAQAAAEYWSDQLRGDVRQDNGDPKGSALGTVARKQVHGDGIPEAKLETFEQALADQLEGEEPDGKHIHVAVDYGPGKVLSKAAEAAGISADTVTFPWKTRSWVEPDRFLVGEHDVHTTSADWPPVVWEIQADPVEFSIEPSIPSLERTDLQPWIHNRLESDRYDGYPLTIRDLEGLEVLDTERFEPETGSDRLRVRATASAVVFVSEEYVEHLQQGGVFGVAERVRETLSRSEDTNPLSKDVVRELVASAFEKYEVVGVDVHEVDVHECYTIEAW